jgi:hypothetical protein
MKRVLAHGMTTAAAAACEVSAGAAGQVGPFQGNLHVTGVYVEVGSSVAASTASVSLRYGNSSGAALTAIALLGNGEKAQEYIPFSIQCGYAEIYSPTTHAAGVRGIIYGK